MARYLDSGSGDPTKTLGHWLNSNLLPGIKGFRCQFGYYGYRALYPFEDTIRDVAAHGYPVHFVLGSNKASLIQSHLEWTLELLRGVPNASLTVIAFNNAEFHPKTVHIDRADGSTAAIVGSGNLTESGLGLNVEAGIGLDSRDGDDAALLAEIAAAVDRWRGEIGESVFSIEDGDDILALKEAKIIDQPQPKRPRPGGGDGDHDDDTGLKVGSRKPLWIPSRRPRTIASTGASAGGGAGAGTGATAPTPTTPAPVIVPTATARTVMRWCKKLRSSDAQWVDQGTNPTGKLRLSKAKFPIDWRRYFRYEFFGDQDWKPEVRDSNPYYVAHIEFDVTVRGASLGRPRLMVDHAPHREEEQDNVPTCLAWGPTIGRLLTRTSHIDDWVVIERDTQGNFTLTIQQNRPAWAP